MPPFHARPRSFLALAAFALLATATAAKAQEPLTVFAAASLKNALEDVGKSFTAQTEIPVRASFAASSQLARQIEQGAPAEVFISADIEWMDYLAQRNLIEPETRANLLGNRIVVIAPKDSPLSVVKLEAAPLRAAIGDGRLVTGEVSSVPVGRYARAALEKLGLWQEVQPKIAMADNVRAALVLVARGEAPLGIVYATDAAAEPNVKIVATFPESSHPPIVYPVAAVKGAGDKAKPFLAFLRSDLAKAAFEKQGFSVLGAR